MTTAPFEVPDVEDVQLELGDSAVRQTSRERPFRGPPACSRVDYRADANAALTRATVLRNAPVRLPVRLPRGRRDGRVGLAPRSDALAVAARRWSSARRCRSAA
jgi:hypothetical protein